MNIDEKRLYAFTGSLNGISISGLAVELSMPQAGQLLFHDTCRGHLARGTVTELDGVVTVRGHDEEAGKTELTFRPITVEEFESTYRQEMIAGVPYFDNEKDLGEWFYELTSRC